MRPGTGETVAAAVGVAAIFLVLRLFALDADLPARLASHYQDVGFTVFDEGWWTANARQSALFGRALGTGFDLVWVSPVFTAVERVAFAAGGVSLAMARAASVVVGLAGVLLLLAIDPRARSGRIAAFLVAVSFAGAQLGRLALPETTGTMLGLAGAVVLVRGGRRGAAFAGIFAGLAALAKPHFVTLGPALALAAFLLARRRGESAARPAALVLAGMLIPLALWGTWAASRSADVTPLVHFYGAQRWFARPSELVNALVGAAKPALQVLVSGTVYRHALFAHFPFAFVLAVLAIPAILVSVWRRDRDVPDSVVVFATWGLVGGLGVASLPFQPLRYWAPLVPAFAYVGAWAVIDRGAVLVASRGRIARAGAWFAGVVVAAQLFFALLRPFVVPALVERAAGGRVPNLHPPEIHLTSFLLEVARTRSLSSFASLPREHAELAALSLLGAVCVVGALTIGLLAARPLARAPALLPSRVPAVAVLCLWLGYELVLWSQWAGHREWTIRDMGRALDAQLPRESVVSPAGTYSLESGLEFDSRAVLDGRMFDPTGGATHIVALVDHRLIGVLEEGEVERRWPGSERLATFSLTGGFIYGLWALPSRESRR